MNKEIYCIGMNCDHGYGIVNLDEAKFFECFDDAAEFMELLDRQDEICNDADERTSRSHSGYIHKVELIVTKNEKNECF